ncbi:MAG: hypothetical protein ACR2HZ_09550 [Gemmatimonadaceae bacterium]
MRVRDVQMQPRGDVVRMTARLTWEDRDHPDDVVWFDWPAEFADSAAAQSNPALLAAFPLAMLFGERRVAVEGEVCPRLADGSRTSMAFMAMCKPHLRPPTLEVNESAAVRTPPTVERRAALCFSGGVDSLAALRINRQTVPRGHAASFVDALYIFGLNTYDFEAGVPVPERLAVFAAQRERLERLGEATGLTLITAATNLRSLYPSWEAWGTVIHVSPHAAVAHGLSQRIRSLGIASAGAGIALEMRPNPMIDAFNSSHALDVYTLYPTLSRLDRVRLIARWPEGLAALRVCFLIDLPDGGVANCGECEKCVRTKLELLAVGALDGAPFPFADVTPEIIDRVSIGSYGSHLYFAECAPALESRGYGDLARAMRRAMARYEARQGKPDTKPPWWRRVGRG